MNWMFVERRKEMKQKALLLLLLALACVLTLGTHASAREIRNVMGRCLDVAGGVNANRTNVQIFECNGSKSQQWSFRDEEIRNVMGRCLDVAGGVNANRTNVQIFECNGSKSQQWELR